LHGINAQLDKLEIKIKPTDDKEIQTELFFDEGQIVMELEGLEFSGTGLITDPETNVQDRLTVHA
jgi:hypothetical protein